MKKCFFLLLFFSSFSLSAQRLAPLTVDKIMRDPSWIGFSPSQPFWSPNGQRLYFFWNPDESPSDSLYFITVRGTKPQKTTSSQRQLALAERSGVFNADRNKIVFQQNNSLKVLDIPSGHLKTLLQTSKNITYPHFSFHDMKVIFRMEDNLYACSLSSGSITQLTNFKDGRKPGKESHNRQEEFLRTDALENSLILRRRKAKAEVEKKAKRRAPKMAFPKPVYIEHKSLQNLLISPDGRFVTYTLVDRSKNVKYTEVPNYVTRSGYTESIPSRPTVGYPRESTAFYIYDRKRDSSYRLSIKQIPGIRYIPSFYKNYPDVYDSLKEDQPLRKVVVNGPLWNKSGTKALVVVRSLDHKDRWIMLLNAQEAQLKLLTRQHDSAWIGGPGIGYTYSMGSMGWVNENTYWFQSEKTGYSHLYLQNVVTRKITPLTQGKYEVQKAVISPDKKWLYITTNQVAPGQTQFYQLNLKTKEQSRITQMMGGNEVTVSPDGRYLAILHSTAIHPWELYTQPNKAGTSAQQITDKAESREYKSYPWQKPEIITFTDRDGFSVYASVYQPRQPAKTRPGVIFVHGAGYLQDVKHYWSYYFREHLFINLLTAQGYTVMDIDYRGSAGYGRDWRTAIYRHMGGNDLEDIVDGARYMIDSLGVNRKRIGLWGGSYGGFLTLMALFKTDIFACGAALRSVTDWAHYNDGYTSNILNLPQDDSIAYVRSSPIYFAKGLQGHLLMCHGMIDTNVHFQDIVRLTQKLIELKKDHWELAVYPLESHAFKEPESWRDEYTRIYQLFETHLK